MNELAPVLDKLAAKLGVTAQYLWGVLLKQAPVAAYTMAAEYVLTVIVIVVIWRSRERLAKLVMDAENEAAQFGAVICLLIFAAVSIIWLLACAFSFETFVTAWVNPEYWALEKVMSAVKAK